MDDLTYNRARDTAEGALQILLDEARAGRAFWALWGLIEWCVTNAEARTGQHTSSDLLRNAGKAAESSTMGTTALQDIDAHALRAVIARVHLNKLAGQPAQAKSELTDAFQRAQAITGEGPDAAMDSILSGVRDVLRNAVEIAGYAALLEYPDGDHQGAGHAQRRGELFEVERQVALLYNALHPQPA